MFQFVLDKFGKKFNGRDAKLILMASRMTLPKAVLLTIPNYFRETTTLLLIRICKEIEKLTRKFIWGAFNGKWMTILVKWAKCCQPLECGNLAIRHLREQNFSFYENFWAQVMQAKYKVGDGCPTSVSLPACSFVLTSLMKVWDDVRGGLFWMLGDSCLTRFCSNVWVVELGPLRNYCLALDRIDKNA
ncbi:hypothetical protein V6Z12_A12G086700 [Gossypium hirsutum]